MVPSGRRSVTTPRAVRMLGLSASARPPDCTRLATGLQGPQSTEEEEDRRPEQDHEHRREDEEHEWEQDLDRRLLGLLLCNGIASPAHLVSEIAHDLPDRDTKAFALDDRADERSHRGQIGRASSR